MDENKSHHLFNKKNKKEYRNLVIGIQDHLVIIAFSCVLYTNNDNNDNRKLDCFKFKIVSKYQRNIRES